MAATELAARVASEWGCSSELSAPIGKFREQSSVQRIGYCTDSRLLNIIRSNPNLDGIDCVVVDEVHERSVSTDLLLGCLKGVLIRRPDLRLVLTSATMNRKVFQDFYSDVCCRIDTAAPKPTVVPVVEVPGRTFPVVDHYEEAEDDYVTLAWRRALTVHKKHPPGDIIVFLATVVDIERACQCLRRELGIEGDAYEGRDALVLPLHGKLQPEENQRAFNPPPSGKRKIVFSTSIAETSVTIDGVVYVIDSGMANVSGYDQLRNMTFLDIRFITKSSVRQRRGRAGRTRPGVCFHLYSEEAFTEMEDTQVPEIRRTNLTQTVLKLISLFGERGGNVHDFEFIERPSVEAIDDAIRSLDELGAISPIFEGGLNAYILTESGSHMLKLDYSPEVCRMIFDGVSRGIQSSIVALASLLIAGSYVFYRGGSEDAKKVADLHKATFCEADADESFPGDWIAMLNVYKQWVEKKKDHQWSKDHCVMQKTLKMADKIATNIREALVLMQIAKEDLPGLTPDEEKRLIKSSICAGYFKNIALSVGGGKSTGMKVARIKDRMVLIHPSSVLSMMGSTPKCVVYDELVKTSRYFIRGVTVVDIETVIQASPRFAERTRLRELSQQQLVACEFENIGPAIRSRIFGFRGKNLQELESSLQVTVDMEQGATTLRLWTSRENLESARLKFTTFLENCKEEIKKETIEMACPEFNIRSVISCGAAANMILNKNEFRKAIIRGLPANFPWSSATEIVAKAAGVSASSIIHLSCLAVSSDGKTSWGTVLCTDPKVCAEVVCNLDKSCPCDPMFEGCEIVAHYSGESKADEPIISDTTIKVTWNSLESTGEFFIQFDEEGHAIMAEEILQQESSKLILQRQSSRVVSRNGSKVNCFVNISSLDEDYIRRTLYNRRDLDGVKDVQVKRRPPQTNIVLSVEVALFNSLFTACGQVMNVSMFPTNEKNGRGKAYVTFADHSSVIKAVQEYDGRVGVFGNPISVLRVVADISCLYRIPPHLYPKLSSLLKAEKLRLEGILSASSMVTISGPIEKGLKGATIKIETSQIEALGGVKLGFDRILGGHALQLNNSDDIAVLIRRTDGKKLLEKLSRETNCYIQANSNTNSIRLYGPEEDVIIVQDELRKYVQSMKQDQETVLRLRGIELHRLIGAHADALDHIEHESGASLISVNWYKSSISILGREEAREQAQRIILERIAAASNDSSEDSSSSDDTYCKLCFTDPEDYTLLLCGHKCCRSCLSRMLSMFARPDSEIKFPIKCPIDPTCREMVALADIRACTDYLTFECISKESTKKFIENSRQYRFCFSASCNGILNDIEEQRGYIRCSLCSQEFCSSCVGKDEVRGVPWHKGLSCPQYRSMQKDGGESLLRDCLKKGGGQYCPFCGDHIQRTIGCDHIRCTCGRDFCYQCGRPSGRSSCMRPCC